MTEEEARGKWEEEGEKVAEAEEAEEKEGEEAEEAEEEEEEQEVAPGDKLVELSTSSSIEESSFPGDSSL